MPTVEELVVKAKPEGIEQTSQQFEQMEGQVEDTAQEVGDQSDQLTEFAAQWKGAMGAIIAGLGVAVGGLLNRVPAIGTAMEQLNTTITLVAFQIDRKLRPQFNKLNSSLAETNTKVSQAEGPLDAIATAILGINSALNNFQVGVINNALDSIAGFTIPKPALRFFANLQTFDIMGIFTQLAEAFRNPEQVGRAVLQFTDEIGVMIVNGLVEPPLQWGRDAIRNLATGINNAASVASQTLSKFLNGVSNGFNNLVDGAINWGRSVINDFVSGIENRASSVSTTITNIVDGIESTINSLISDAVSLGRELVNNFISGIENAPGGDIIGDISGGVDSVVSNIQQGIDATVSGGGGFGASRGSQNSIIIDGRDVTSQTGRYRADETANRGIFD